MTMGFTNGHQSDDVVPYGAERTYRKLYPGVYVPLPTFFDAQGELDTVSIGRHLLNMCSLGMIPVVSGSLGEAVHLDQDERKVLIRTARSVLDANGLRDVPIVAGVGGASTRETVRLANDAIDAGADAGMIIPPAYFAGLLSADQSQIVSHFAAVSSSVKLPLLLYNFPSNAGGLDLTSTTIKAVIEHAPTVVGVKLTCPGSMGKLLRLRQHLDSNPQLSASRPDPFLFLDGLIADLVPWTQCRGDGTVSGLMNYVPRCCMRLWDLCLRGREGKLSDKELLERDQLQAVLGEVDVAAVPGGVRAMKYALNKLHGYGDAPRLPLCPLSEVDGERFMGILEPALVWERRYEAASGQS